MRLLVLLALSFPLVVQAQPSSGTTVVHALPFEGGKHTLELALAGAEGAALRVDVTAAPSWVRFASREADAHEEAPHEEAATRGTEPVARLSFTVDEEAPVGEAGAIRVSVLDAAGVVWAEHEVHVEVAPPREARLSAVRPNPSRGRAAVSYVVSDAERVRLSVVDVLGREVAVLVDEEASPGAHEAQVPTGGLASGVYVVVLRVEGALAQQRVQRMTVVR